MTKQTEAEIESGIAEWRMRYPDLTEAEERNIRRHLETGESLFFRCIFENDQKIGFQLR